MNQFLLQGNKSLLLKLFDKSNDIFLENKRLQHVLMYNQNLLLNC